MPKMDFKKATPKAPADEDVEKKAPADESEEDELDLDETDAAADEEAGTEEADGSEGADEEAGEESDESEDAEEEEKKPEPKKGKAAKKKGAAPLDAEDAAKGVRKEPNVNPTDKIGDLMEDRRFALRSKALHTREYLAGQDLVQTMIPRSENEAKDASQYYNINGFAFYVRKGVFQMVPSDVAKLISDTYGQDATLVANHPLNLNNNTSAAKEFSR